jgi:hypothetical protein
MKQLSPYIFLLISTLLFIRCSTDQEVELEPIDLLPPTTTEQANTFGCLFNGEAWLPGSDIFLFDHTRVMFFPSNGNNSNSIQVSSQRRYTDKDIRDALDIVLFFNDSLEINSFYFKGFSETHGCWEYSWDTLSDSSLEVLKLDFENQIFAATFNFNLISDCDSTDLISIEEGRMDYVFF